MPLADISKAVQSLLEQTGYPICNGIRVAEQPLPVVVYEITSAELSVPCPGVLAKNHWTIVVEAAGLADDLQEVNKIGDAVVGLFPGPVVDGTNDVTITLAGFSIGFSTDTPDDGKHDAERIGTISLTLLIREL